jgi:hypothetical protein
MVLLPEAETSAMVVFSYGWCAPRVQNGAVQIRVSVQLSVNQWPPPGYSGREQSGFQGSGCMTGSADSDEHVQLQLGLYVLGGLSPDEHVAVGEHLARCAVCRAESMELAEIPALLSLLTAGDIEELTRESPVPVPHAAPVSAKPARDDATGPRSEREDSTGPGRARRARLSGRTRFVLASVLVALVVGVGIGVWLRGTAPDAITLVGSETNAATGVAMSVTVVGHDQQSHVDITGQGFSIGTAYQLQAVDVQGHSPTIAQWVANRQSFTFSGDLNVAPADLASFSVTRADGTVVVTVKVAEHGG